MFKLPLLPLKLRSKFLILFICTCLIPLALATFIILLRMPNTGFSLMILLAILLISAIITLLFVEQIVRPIEQIYLASKRFGGGELGFRVRVKTGDEIESLADSFNAMADNLNRSIAALLNDKATMLAERNRLALVLAGMTDSVIAVDQNRKISIFNNAAENLLGYTAQEALGQPIDQIMKIYDQNEELTSSMYCPIGPSPEAAGFTKQAIKVLGKGNKQSYVNFFSGQIRTASVGNLGCVITMHDKTSEKNLEEMKLDFVSMAAHELRTPLTSIRGYLDVLHKEATLEGEFRLFLERAMIASSQLVDLVENLLSVSRIERGVLLINPAAIDWLTYVRQNVAEFSQRAKDKGLELTFNEPTHQIPQVMADKMRVKEVLSNLISNAINYTKSGKITVTVETDPQSKMVTTHVQDTGEGIPKEAIPKLFTKFFRVSGPLEHGPKGTGLGLYISKTIIDMHHGKIWVDSELGKGSTFSFSLSVA